MPVATALRLLARGMIVLWRRGVLATEVGSSIVTPLITCPLHGQSICSAP